MKISMIKLYDYLKDKKSNLILQIHDEVLIEINNLEEDFLVNVCIKIMENATELDFKLRVNKKIKSCW